MRTMRFIQKLRLVIAAVVGIPVLLFMAYMGISEWISGSGTLHVVAPYDGPLTVRLDGEDVATVPAGAHHELEIEQGEHGLELVRADGQGVVHDLDVDSGFYETLAPAQGQCFVELDGTEAYYGHDPAPEVEDRHFAAEPFEVGSSHYYGEGELPGTISDNASVYLIFEVPCAMSSSGDSQLLVAAGYGG